MTRALRGGVGRAMVATMNRVRTIDFGAFDRARYDTQFLYQGESCVVIGSHVPAGLSAYGHHRHQHCDQLYYIVRGEMHVQLGTDVATAGPDTVVHIPRGLPHHNWNAGAVDEFHLEVLAPAPRANLPLATPTDDTDTAGLSATIAPLDPAAYAESARFPGFALNRPLRDGTSAHAALYVGTVQPGAGGPGTHVHEFDQCYFVLEGELTVEIGFDRHTVPPCSLVTIPAGVPHRQWNDGRTVERHIALNTPLPATDRPLDVGVSFVATGEVI